MRLSSHALWPLAALLPGLQVATAVEAAAAPAAGVLQVDLIFPQDGEVYAPTADMPFVFALQNAGLAKYSYPSIYMGVMNRSDPELHTLNFQYDYKDLHWTSNEPYFPYYFFAQFATEGSWSVDIQFWWGTCLTSPDGRFTGRMDSNTSDDTYLSIAFTIKNGGKAIDIPGALANGKPCAGDAITVGDEVYTPSNSPRWALPSGKCVVANHTTHSACPATIDPAVVANISADITRRVCGRPARPASCPPPSKSAAQRLAAALAGPALLVVAVGALGLFEVLA